MFGRVRQGCRRWRSCREHAAVWTSYCGHLEAGLACRKLGEVDWITEWPERARVRLCKWKFPPTYTYSVPRTIWSCPIIFSKRRVEPKKCKFMWSCRADRPQPLCPMSWCPVVVPSLNKWSCDADGSTRIWNRNKQILLDSGCVYSRGTDCETTSTLHWMRPLNPSLLRKCSCQGSLVKNF